jgi:hypothetical protein
MTGLGSQWWRLKQVANLLNGSTVLGLGVAAGSGASLSRGPRGLVLAAGYRWPLPNASACTIGNVVLSRHEPAWLHDRPRLLRHEERHSWQYVVTLGLPMLPLYGAAAAWSWLRARDPATHNVFETAAGLEDGGYPPLSRRLRRRRTA